MRRTIGYAKLGRSMPLRFENCGSLGGDVEMVPTLKLLAERHPDVDFMLIGRNSGEEPRDVGLPDNVYNPWVYWAPEVRRRINARGLNYANLSIEDHRKVAEILRDITADTIVSLDGIVMWLGQHGTTNTPLPSIRDRSKLTKPYDWATLYGSYLLQGINMWRGVDPLKREEVLLNSDPRNYIKYRDSEWPWLHAVLGQYRQITNAKHERNGLDDTVSPGPWSRNTVSSDGVWSSKVRTVYARLEISGILPGTPFGDTLTYDDNFDRRHHFGMIVNETRRQVNPAKSRINVLRKWVLPLSDVGFIHGKWSDRSERELGTKFTPVPVADYANVLRTTRTTFTTPASGSGWATAKAWESFAVGVVCFFHPDYDDQDHILGDAPTELRDFLRVKTPDELRRRIDLCRDPDTWRWAVALQHEHFLYAVDELRYLKIIERRLGL